MEGEISNSSLVGRYHIEVAITDGQPPDFIRTHCVKELGQKHGPARESENRHKIFSAEIEYELLVKQLTKLEFESLKARNVEHLENCLVFHRSIDPAGSIADATSST